jgi:hypothetical protein
MMVKRGMSFLELDLGFKHIRHHPYLPAGLSGDLFCVEAVLRSTRCFDLQESHKKTIVGEL